MAGFENGVVNSWLLDYAYEVTWNEFRMSKAVDSHRDLIQWVLTQQYDASNERQIKYYILLLLCRLADGECYDTRYTTESTLTVLEEGIECFENLQIPLTEHLTNVIPDLSNRLNFVHTKFLEQAVLVCCRSQDFDTATEVFNRLCSSGTQSINKDCERKLKTILKAKNHMEALKKENSYYRFLKNIHQLLSDIDSELEPSYLTKLAQNECGNLLKSPSKKQHSEASNGKSPQKSPSHRSPKKRRKENNDVPEVYRSKYLKRKFRLNELKIAATEMGLDCEVPTFLTHNQREALHTHLIVRRDVSKRTLVGRENFNCNNSRIESSSDEDMEVRFTKPQSKEANSSEEKTENNKRKSLATRVGARDILKKGVPKVSTKRSLKWTDIETEEFYKAVQKCGLGKWVRCKEMMATHRYPVHLKDRWRTMLKCGIVDELKEKFGDIPR